MKMACECAHSLLNISKTKKVAKVCKEFAIY